MKRLLFGLLLLPLLNSCIAQQRYNEPGYYPPPPPRVEVRRYHPHRHHHRHHDQVAPRARVYQEHVTNHVTVHGNEHAVVARPSQRVIAGQQQHVLPKGAVKAHEQVTRKNNEERHP